MRCLRRSGAGRRLWLLLLLALCLIPGGCRAPETEETAVLLDGKAYAGDAAGQADGGLRVYITLDGAALIDLPFSEEHSVTVRQADGSENTVRMTGTSVFMESANCENQDCVRMGEVTEENLELRVMGGFIICLPHRISVEVRDSGA